MKEELAIAQEEIPSFPPRTVNVGRVGSCRKIEFRKLMMDKDYIWKLEVILQGRIEEIEMAYHASIILDPSEYNSQLANLHNEAMSKQMSLESVTGKITEGMKRVHEAYQSDVALFGIVDFRSAVLKLENKPFSQQIIQLVIDNKAAQDISGLLDRLDSAAIVLRPLASKDEEDEE